MIHRTINTTKLEPDIANTKISVFDDEDGDLPGFLVCTRPERKCWTYMQLGFAHSTKTAGVENPRGGREARNFTTNVPEILDFKSSSEQIFCKTWRWVPLISWGVNIIHKQDASFEGTLSTINFMFIDLSCQLLRWLSFFRTTLVKCLQPTRLPRVLLWCRF